MQKAILVGINTGTRGITEESSEETLNELSALAETAGAETVATVIQNRQLIEPATLIGKGKLEEVCELCRIHNPDYVIFDDELSGSQVRNLEEATGVTVLDRSRLILDIFAERATSGEGKCQVELAQLKYMFPRLSGIGASLSRQGGGIGSRGPGETKLETDKRHIQARINKLRADLKEIEKHRGIMRSQRLKTGVKSVAIVGYTNAGKSTLINTLTDAETVSEDKLFCTLDPLTKKMRIEDELDVVFTDTVGFIRKLPHHLVEAFKSTLEESVYADLILHVVDASSPEFETHMMVVNNLLSELGAGGKPVIVALNKADKAENIPNVANSVVISAKTGEGVGELLHMIKTALEPSKKRVRLLIPYTDGAVTSFVYERCKIESENHTENGCELVVTAENEYFSKIERYVIDEL
ncbi:MAG: GTPase HflX [Clostridia bacterium]|nr:GTPase HflX [Clostridia bacterium]